MADPKSKETPEARAARMNAPKTALAVALSLDLDLTYEQLEQYVRHAFGEDLVREIRVFRFHNRRSDDWVRDQLHCQFAAFMRTIREWVGPDRKAYYVKTFHAPYLEYAHEGYAVLVSKGGSGKIAGAKIEVVDVQAIHGGWTTANKLLAIPGRYLERLIPLNCYPDKSREALGVPMSLGEWIDARADPEKIMLEFAVPGDPAIALYASGAGIAPACGITNDQTEWLRSMPDVTSHDLDNHYIYAWRRVQRHMRQKTLTFRTNRALNVTVHKLTRSTFRSEISKCRVQDLYGDKLTRLSSATLKMASQFQKSRKKE